MSKTSREPTVDLELAIEHGLSQAEYEDVVNKLGRVPTFTELGVVSSMWSEHCSYKSSRIHLKTLPTEGPQVIEGPGENAGVVDIGDGQAVVFKMESHNHPSFIEPYQGAATGVGGICRDVFTMGARPVAVADCLRFGRPEHPKTKYLVEGVVAGVGGYGNSFGVPNVAGDVNFDASYDGNILVNAFCLGLADTDKIFRGTASGVGNPILYVGAKTGRDGIHGATMASAEFEEDASDEKRPAVQVGDPFMEKLLLEACLELMQSDVLVGIQDMGAAGLTSSSAEMAARAGTGVELELSDIPQRELGMTPYELMLSESQERMLMVVKDGHEHVAQEIFQKWDLDAVVIGRVTDSERLVLKMRGEVVADLPADLLAEGVFYDRPRKQPAYLDTVKSLDATALRAEVDLAEALTTLLRVPDIASKEWVYKQYDYNVRHGTVVRPGQADAGVVRVFSPDSSREKGVAIAAGCQSRWVYLDPYEGTRWVAAEIYASLCAVGATPLATTNCLNFGSPENPEIMWQFAEAVRGLGSACQSFDAPIVSGNVSLYNETDGVAIKPTPMLAMVGLLDDANKALTMAFREGDTVAVVGPLAGQLDGSSYAQNKLGEARGQLAPLDLENIKRRGQAVAALAVRGQLSSAHDISEGGVLVAIAESAIAGDVGVKLDIATGDDEVCDIAFGELPGRYIISFPEANRGALEDVVRSAGSDFTVVGNAVGDKLCGTLGDTAIDISLSDVAAQWRSGLPSALGL